eukprot:CAMPEP_0118670276 /NCGR_PEP_ID=MMETSP0785-20121206/21371_1 /TAXON_ID=91992 /ORGANISM="Bolidomonas pacifica, Strain CCMP 1866" /LENGTH=315 /DNA_ID=CAMNT_0006565061 /DNA_START=145 /DNA_END=1089 /DNA_ORIENTATION=-
MFGSQNQQANNYQDPNMAAAAYQQGAADAIQQMQKVGSVGDLQVLGDMNIVGEGGGGGFDRSVSMPDMASLDAKAIIDDDKRKKRLARNRASARLRRLRKKNLVESYEAEVGVLESSLAKLKEHKWGTGQHESLLEALSMDRGQQALPQSDRKALIQTILTQQYSHVCNLLDSQLESVVLNLYCRSKQGEGGGVQGVDEETKKGRIEIFKEIDDLLGLSQAQVEKLSKATSSSLKNRGAITTSLLALNALKDSEWLQNSGIETTTSRFLNILNPTQTSKFLLWTDNNSESIELLDYVNAPKEGALPNKAPVFFFG